MNKNIKVACAMVTFLTLGACASSSQPKREAYVGEDQVGAITKEMITGRWEVRILNPIKGEQTAENPVVNYSPDGTVTMDSKFDSGGMGVMEMEVSGTWLIEGELLQQKATDVREKSGSALGVVVKLFKGTMLRNANATLNVYEASSNRLLIVSDDGQAQELTRLQ